MSSNDYVWKNTDAPARKTLLTNLVSDKTGKILYATNISAVDIYFNLVNIFRYRDSEKKWTLLYLPLSPFVFTITSIACDATGEKVVVCVNNVKSNVNLIYLSNDFGETFQPFVCDTLPTTLYWNHIACNTDCTFLIVAGYDPSYRGKDSIYILINSGATWSIQDSIMDFGSISSLICYTKESEICAAITILIEQSGYVYLYNSNGTGTWNKQTIVADPTLVRWNNIASNSNGSKLSVCGYDRVNDGGLVYFYNGTIWSNQTPEPNLDIRWQHNAVVDQQVMLSGNPSQQYSSYVYFYDNNTGWTNITNEFNISANSKEKFVSVLGNSAFYLSGYLIINEGGSGENKAQDINNGIFFRYTSKDSLQNLTNDLLSNNLTLLLTTNAEGDRSIAFNYMNYQLYTYQDKIWNPLETNLYDYELIVVNMISNETGNQICIVGRNKSDDTSKILISTDFGTTFKVSETSLNNFWIACNGSGNTIISVVYYKDGNYPNLIVSNNNGTSWDIKNNGLPSDLIIYDVCCNQEGNVLGLTSLNHGLYLSKNTGDFWYPINTGLPLNLFWTNIACDQTGKKLTALGFNKDTSELFVYISLNQGLTWSKSIVVPIIVFETISFFLKLCMNKQGNVILFSYVDNTGSHIQLSTDGGMSWTLQSKGLPYPTTVSDLAMNGSGDLLLACCLGIGTNGGVFSQRIPTEPPIPPEPEPPISNICFAADTLVLTDQGYLPIEQIDPLVHTMNGSRKIVAISKTRSQEPYWVSIQKHALEKNIPFQKTRVSAYHRIFYEEEWIPAYELAEREIKGIKKIVYHEEPLYNVLLEKHGTMIANGLTTETLHPRSAAARYFMKRSENEVKTK